MKPRLLWGVGVLGALAAPVGCSSSSDTSKKPPLDLITCAKSSVQDDTCMACCGKAGFNGYGPGPDGACACAVVVIDQKACGKQPTADSCNSCCADASFATGEEDSSLICQCIGASNDTVCSSSNTDKACSQCCADNMFLSGYVTNTFRCTCTTS